MGTLKLYVLAMYAMKLDPERINFTPQPDGTVKWELKEMLDEQAGLFPAVSLWAVAAIARSEEQAQEMGMRRLLAERPWQEGWVNHHVTINLIPHEVILKITNQTMEEAGGEDDNDDDEGGRQEWPELVM